MASPEIELPVGEVERVPTKSGMKGAIPQQESSSAQDQKVASSITQHDAASIKFQYLTFDTDLPSTTDRATLDNCSCTPGSPDLRDYVSPFTWSESRKTLTTVISCLVTICTAYTAGAYAPASTQLAKQWHVSQTAVYVGITMYTTGFAVAPMVLAPFSELNGRKPVFVVTGILFVLCQLCCAVTRSYPGMLVARFFAGVGGSTFSTMVGGVISDIYHTEGIIRA